MKQPLGIWWKKHREDTVYFPQCIASNGIFYRNARLWWLEVCFITNNPHVHLYQISHWKQCIVASTTSLRNTSRFNTTICRVTVLDPYTIITCKNELWCGGCMKLICTCSKIFGKGGFVKLADNGYYSKQYILSSKVKNDKFVSCLRARSENNATNCFIKCGTFFPNFLSFSLISPKLHTFCASHFIHDLQSCDSTSVILIPKSLYVWKKMMGDEVVDRNKHL